MQKILREYKGVILFFIVLIIMASFASNNVEKLDKIENDNNTISYYEK